MHICFITSEYPKNGYRHGGVGSFIKMLSKELVNSGIKVTVLGINYKGLNEEVEIIDGVKVIRLKNISTKGLTWLINSYRLNKKIKEINQENKISIIESAELGLAFIKKISGIKYIIRMHGGHHFFANAENRNIEKWKAFQEIRSFKKADAVIAVSNYVGTRSQELINLSFNFTTIYNPININLFQKADNQFDKNTVFFAGSLVEKKGIRQLIQAIKIVKNKYPDIKLKIAGKFGNIPGTNKSYESILKKEVTPEIKNNIEFLGLVPNNEIPKLINKSHICCYPSHMEAMPIAWLEVMAMGKLFIASKTGPGPEIITDGVNGFLVDPHSPEDIANKIIEVLSLENGDDIANKSRNHVLENYDLQIIKDQNIDFFSQIINNN